jgi:uncharacterized OB-fold protein
VSDPAATAPLRPVPLPDDASEEFWAACDRGELIAQRCSSCGRWRFPPRPTCPTCRSFDFAWEPLAGTGRVWSWVRVHPPLLPAFAAMAPYVSLVVELDEDPVHLRMVGRLDGDAEPAMGDRVRVGFEEVGERRLPLWRLGLS